jgi:hypothetical protein
MATYYGYKEREDPKKSMIDWSGITKEITDGLYAESKRREEEKFTLDQNYVKQLNDLNEYSQGLDPTVNQAMLGYVQNYRDYLLENHKMMKSGVITVNDSKIAKQGALDSFNNLNNVIKGVNAKLDELQKAGGELNDDQMASLAELVQFKNQQLLIDPRSGTASLAKRNEDGTIDKNTIVPVGAAYQMFTPYEQRNINEDIQKPIKGIGEWTTAASYLTSVSDLRNNPEYKTWVDGVVKEMTADKRTLASYGASLGLTIDGGDIIKKNNAGSISYELTPKARGKVEEAIKSAIEVRIDREVKKVAPIDRETSGQQTQAKKDTKLYETSMKIANGEVSSFREFAGNDVTTTGPKGTKVTKKLDTPLISNGRMYIRTTDGQIIESISLNDKKLAGRNIAKYIRGAKGTPDDIALQWEAGEKLSSYQGPGEGVELATESNQIGDILDTISLSQSSDKAVQVLKQDPALKALGITFETEGWYQYGQKTVVFKDANGRILEQFSLNSPSGIEQMRQWYIKNNIPLTPKLIFREAETKVKTDNQGDNIDSATGGVER